MCARVEHFDFARCLGDPAFGERHVASSRASHPALKPDLQLLDLAGLGSTLTEERHLFINVWFLAFTSHF